MKDILISSSGDLKIQQGDFVIGDAAQQHVELILLSSPGNWKFYPTLGCSIVRALKGSVSRFLKNDIKTQLRSDGFEVKTLNITSQGIQIDGSYGR